MKWDDDRTQDLTISRSGAGVILPGDRATFVLDPSSEPPTWAVGSGGWMPPERPPVARRDPDLDEPAAFAAQLARHRRWLIVLTVAVALLVPPAAVVYGAAIAIARAVLQGAW